MRHLLSVLIGVLLMAGGPSVLAAEDAGKVVCKSSRWEIRQSRNQETQWQEVLHFREPGLAALPLEGLAWPGVYETSPDGQWLLRVQKVGSGESVGMLYRIEESGRVSAIAGFDDLLWSASPLRKSQLYHTGISSVEWAGDSTSMKVGLRGKGEGESGVEITILYDMTTHRVRRL